MHIIKEHKDNHVILRTFTYAHTIDYFMGLFEEAKKDFPSLDIDVARVVNFGGRRYKGTMGIEFETVFPIPDTYKKIETMEWLL